MQTLPSHKTKLVCTIGPASQAPATLEQMIRAGLNVARLNFSHGDFASHKAVIDKIRAAARAVGRRVAIMADLPGPKIRIGQFVEEPIELETGANFDLTTDEIVGDQTKVSVSFAQLPQVVKAGDTLFLNDGFIQLEVLAAQGSEVRCKVLVGGELRSRKGLNLPGIDLGISAFTERDRECLKFALEQGVDAVSQSFVATAADIEAVRQAAAELGYDPFIIAKIERAGARDHLESILKAADGVMIARGDLGVEIPIEQIAVVQKRLMELARSLGKPIITATQMLESMVRSRRPTRAEATDVANAILDGTDAVMLSEESAMGRYPVDAVAMLGKIAAATEPHRHGLPLKETLQRRGQPGPEDLIAFSVNHTLEYCAAAAVLVPTVSGTNARNIARFRLPVWIAAVSTREATCQALQFSYGVQPLHVAANPADWNAFARDWLHGQGLHGDCVVLTKGPSEDHPGLNHQMEILDLRADPQ